MSKAGLYVWPRWRHDGGVPVTRVDAPGGAPEVVTMGRVSVDLYPEQVGVSLAQAQSFSKTVGGSATNVCVAAARLGRRCAVITKVGDDGFGPYIRAALEGFGVDTRWVGTHPSLRTPVVFCEIHPPDHFPLLFYREPSAPDIQIYADELDLEAIARAPLFWTTGTGLSDHPSRDATLTALEHRAQHQRSERSGSGGITVHDLDYRPMFWSSGQDAGRLAREAAANASVVVGNLDEVAVAVGERSPDESAAALLDLGVDLAIVKMGPRGVLARSRTERVVAPPIGVEVRNGLGAGDAFGGALCHGLLSGWETERTVRYANAAGALVAARMTCADDMPDDGEVRALLDEAPRGEAHRV